jgi:uncharacterized protein (UPF0332 family)
MFDPAALYRDKARESLAGAESELDARRYNNAAKLAYFACFQAAVAALIQAGSRRSGADAEWKHDFVQAEIRQRRLVPAELGSALLDTMRLRHLADYAPRSVSERNARQTVARARSFVAALGAIREGP